MMADYGAGAACGAFANTEDALPPEFSDNLFLSDFGKRQIMRVRVQREGGTYRALSKEDLFPNPPGDFRPVGITLGPDGKTIYICDWHHRDEKAQVSVGRLLKLTWTGKDHSTPKPPWYVPLAQGKNFEVDTAELLPALEHPSRSVRLGAQRALARKRETNALLSILRDRTAAAMPRMHALWALDAIDQGVAARQQIMAATADPNPVVKRQALRQLSMRRVASAGAFSSERLKDSDPAVRLQAATLLGRVGEIAAIPALLAALDERDLFARFAIFTALQRIGTNTPSAWNEIVRGLENANEPVREGTTFALREVYDEKLLTELATLFRDGEKPVATRLPALRLIAALHHQPPAWKGQWWAYHPALQPPPPKNVPWNGTVQVLKILRDGLAESDPSLRRASIQGLAAAHDTNSLAALREIFPREADPASRVAILGALGTMKDQAALPLVDSVLNKSAPDEVIAAAIAAAKDIGGAKAVDTLSTLVKSAKIGAVTLAQAIAALGNLGDKSAAGTVVPTLSHANASVRAAALIALGQLQRESAIPLLEAGLADEVVRVRRAAVRALSDLKSGLAVPALLKGFGDESVRREALHGLTRTPDERALDALLNTLSSKNPTERNAAHLAIRDLARKVLARVEARADTLSPAALTELRQIYAGNKKAEAGPIFARRIQQHPTEAYLAAALEKSGEPERGQKLFAEQGGINCLGCHRVAGQGSNIGPDLSGAGTQFDRRALAEAILYPSRAVREGYQQVTVEMSNDDEFNGVVKGETAETLLLCDSTGREHKLARRDIRSRRNSALSLMPEGLHVALTLDEFADLIAYLASLQGAAQTPPIP